MSSLSRFSSKQEYHEGYEPYNPLSLDLALKKTPISSLDKTRKRDFNCKGWRILFRSELGGLRRLFVFRRKFCAPAEPDKVVCLCPRFVLLFQIAPQVHVPDERRVWVFPSTRSALFTSLTFMYEDLCQLELRMMKGTVLPFSSQI